MSCRGQELEEGGYGRQMETKRSKMKEGCLGGANTKRERMEGSRTDRQRENRERARDGECEEAAPSNCSTAEDLRVSSQSSSSAE